MGTFEDFHGVAMLSLEQVRQSLETAGQSHVLRFWSELCEQERTDFLQELSQLDLKGLKEHCEGAARAAACPSASLDQDIEPVPPEAIGSVTKSDKGSLADWENEGECPSLWRDHGNLRSSGTEEEHVPG